MGTASENVFKDKTLTNQTIHELIEMIHQDIQVEQSPAEARKSLFEAGIVDENGQLTIHYR